MAELTTNFEKHSSKNPLQQMLLNNYYKEFFRMLMGKKIESVLDAGAGEGITLRKIKDKQKANNNRAYGTKRDDGGNI